MSLLEELKRTGNTTSAEEILSKLMLSQDIEMKTEIKSPLELANLKILAKILSDNKLIKSAEVLDKFIETYLKYMVSFNREGRKEIIDALKGMVNRETEKSTFQKLFGVKGDNKQ